MNDGLQAGVTVAPPCGDQRFATTHWSMVLKAGRDGNAGDRAALEALCQTYWPPLYAFARREGNSSADAEDLVQGFLADLLKRQAIAVANPERGRFRSFLLTAFRNHCRQRFRAQGAQKRGGGETIVSLDAMRQFESALADDLQTVPSPQSIYDRKWVTVLLGRVFAEVRREYHSIGKAELFDRLRSSLWGSGPAIKYKVLAPQLNMTEGAVKVAVHRLKKRIADQFRAEVAKTVADDEDLEEEMRNLLVVAGGQGL